MMKIMNKLKGSDKLLHSKYGNILLIVYFVFYLVINKIIWLSLIMSALTLLIVGVLKELYDKYHKGTFIDWWDIVASFVPYPIIKHINR